MKSPFLTFVLLFLLPLIATISVAVEPNKSIDLQEVSGAGVLEIKDFSATPNSQGDLAEFPIQLPPFKRGYYIASNGWPVVSINFHTIPFEPGQFGNLRDGGQFVALELESGDWLALLPIGSEQVFSWFRGKGGLKLVVSHFGKEKVEGPIETIAYAKAATPYEAMQMCWKAVADHPRLGKWLKMREAKPYPEMFKYLGWCSWEHFKGAISEEQMTDVVKSIESSGVPVRWVLMDAGHYDKQSLLPHPTKFPNGYQPLLDTRDPDKVRWIGIWWSIYGDLHGVDAPGNLGKISDKMWASHSQEMLPIPGDGDAAKAFYNYMLEENSKGFDFIKVDFQVWPLMHYAGLQKIDRGPQPHQKGLLPDRKRPDDTSNASDNPYRAFVVMSRAMHQVRQKNFQGLIDCNSLATWSLFQTLDSSVARCSRDYKVNNVKPAKSHILESFGTMPWLGQIVWGDHDMFHSSDRLMARLMAVTKALSGAPVYLSDDPKHFKPEVIRPLCYEDGLLLRPLAPAAPVPDDIFFQTEAQSLYRVMAPLPNHSAALAVYNLHGDLKNEKPKIATTLTPAHYAAAPSMMQPYPGNWPIPAEGLLCYDVYGKTASKLGEGMNVEIEGFGDRLFQVSPIQHGWAIIGRTDKYLPAASVEVISSDAKQLKLRLHESGPFAVWLEKGQPKAAGIQFSDKGGGLFEASIPVQTGPIDVTVEK